MTTIKLPSDWKPPGEAHVWRKVAKAFRSSNHYNKTLTRYGLCYAYYILSNMTKRQRVTFMTSIQHVNEYNGLSLVAYWFPPCVSSSWTPDFNEERAKLADAFAQQLEQFNTPTR